MSSGSSKSAAASGSADEADASCSLVTTAMEHIDDMLFKYAQTDAQIGRAKNLASACFTSLKPLLTDALRPHMRPSTDVSQLVDPLLHVFDQLNSKRREGRLRDDVRRLTIELTSRLEALIRRAPTQWHLQQPNWPSDYEALEESGKPYPRPERGPSSLAARGEN